MEALITEMKSIKNWITEIDGWIVAATAAVRHCAACDPYGKVFTSLCCRAFKGCLQEKTP